MIIDVGIALAKVFENLTINVNNQDVSVKFHFGDQKEFNKWQFEQMRYQVQKYPLIWLAPQGNYKTQKNKTIDVESELILFMGTEQNYNNTERYAHNYLTYLKPLTELVENVLSRHPYILLQESPINYFDEPNFGANNDAYFGDSSKKKDPKSITIDIVDARILKIKLNINTNCILT